MAGNASMGARPAAWPAFERTTATTRAESFPRNSRHRLENQHGQHVSLSQEVFVRLDRKRMQSRLLASLFKHFETDRSRPREFIALSPQPSGGDGFHRLWRLQHLLKQANSMKG
jgi:hypothetical protein